MQQILMGGRLVSFFTTISQAVFCGLGFIVLFNSRFIFHKLSFWSISSIQRLRFLMGLYSCIVAQFLIGSLTGSLPTSYTLTSYTLAIGGITWVTCGRHSIRIRCRLSCISFLKARSLRLTSAQYTVFTYSRIRFSIIILISFIKEGIRGIVLGHISRLFCILSCKLRQASYFLLKIILWFPRSVIRRGTLYCLRLLTRRQIHKMLVIGCPTYPLYP